ncbi:MAG: type II secretion system protein [Myxococcales bacterium]|nr:type II secretion system protein [Myxococcales bacterium]
MTRATRQGGFTLIEVVIALAVLFGALVILLRITTSDVWATNRARLLTISTNLARAKMNDLEVELLKDGFQEMAETLDGDFEDEGHPRIRWHALVEKIEIPATGDLEGASSEAVGDKAAIGSGLGAIIGRDDATASAGASLIQSQFGLITGVLENAVRKVTLTVTWKVGKADEAMTVVCYFTDPKAIDFALGGGIGL